LADKLSALPKQYRLHTGGAEIKAQIHALSLPQAPSWQSRKPLGEDFVCCRFGCA